MWPRDTVWRGKTPVLDPREARQLIDVINATTSACTTDRFTGNLCRKPTPMR